MLMESQHYMPRKYQPLSVGKCHAQTATDRFGDGAKSAVRDRERAAAGQHPHDAEIPFTWPVVDSDDEDTHHSIYRLVPSMQKFRMNLTALSQVHNLYFVAYQCRIFVYRPRSVPGQVLPRHPDLQLNPKPSELARIVGGYIDERRPHCINHLVTGFLGEEEIVAATYDDGDVIAYYVKEVASRIFAHGTSQKPSQRTVPRQFFHENVGISAWGLAIHKKSRLIAVSSNRHEVTVFALALNPGRSQRSRHNSQSRREQTHVNTRRRIRNWRIHVLLGSKVDNVPNICFIDNDEGYAEKICAIDIKGFMWMAAVWQAFQPPICVPPVVYPKLMSEEFYPSPSRGWGVLALPESSFMKVTTVEEMLGLPMARVETVPAGPGTGPPFANVRTVVHGIPGNPCQSMSASTAPNRQNFLQGGLPGIDTLLVGDADDEVEDEDEEGGVEIENAELPEELSDGDNPEFEDSSEDTEADSDAVDAEDEEAWYGIQHAHDLGPEQLMTVFDEEDPPGAELTQMIQETLSGLHDTFDELNDALDGYEEVVTNAISGDPHKRKSLNPRPDDPTQVGEDYQADSVRVRLDMTYFPHKGEVFETHREMRIMLGFLQRPFDHNTRPSLDEKAMAQYGKKLYMLRTYENHVELRGFYQDRETGAKEVGVLCPGVMNFGRFRDPGLRNLFHATSRLNMIAHVPELSLIALGSPTGRVVLLTLTRKASSVESAHMIWEHGFRVEWILPTRNDEDAYRKILRPLHGLALGPVQVDDGVRGEVGGRDGAVPRRYRLMLHYRNHDILSYEITREEQTGKLCIF